MNYNSNLQPVSYQYYPPNLIFRNCGKLSPQAPTDANGTPTGAGWAVGYCYCCCSCLAYGTLIAVPGDQHRTVQSLCVGDEVLAGSLDANGGISWTPAKLGFSDGAESEVIHDAIYIAFGDDEWSGDLICSMDQPVMLAHGKLTTADMLQPGDELLHHSGKPVTVQSVAIGTHRKGIHHIGTVVPRGSVNGHLIVAGGVVVGDYYLQLYYSTVAGDMHDANVAKRPSIGTPEYGQLCKAVEAKTSLHFGAMPERGTSRIAAKDGSLFTVYSSQPSFQGQVSPSLFTEAQALDILTNGSQLPLSNPIPRGEVENLFKTFAGFFPGLVFYLDWYQMEPNAYAVEQYGKQIVVINGGLARMTGLGYEGMAMAIAHLVNRFAALPPVGVNHFTGTGASDYYAFASTSRSLWWGSRWMSYIKPAMAQFHALFSLISQANAAGNPADPVNEPSIDCRWSAIQSGAGGGAVPTCCGGPQLPQIAIESVTGTTTGADLSLTVAPMLPSATDPANYALSPAAPVTAVTQDPNFDFKIHLTATLEAGTDYTVTIQNLESVLGTGVDPQHASMSFKVS